MRRRLLLVPIVLLALGTPATAAVFSAAPAWPTWDAEPAWISNTGVHRGGEFVYQDYLYDDHGANTDGINRLDAPIGSSPSLQEAPDPRMSSTSSVRYAGDYTYPSNGSRYDNVADLVEMRVALHRRDVAYLFRLGALTRPDEAVVGVCVDQDRNAGSGLFTWPLGAGVSTRLGCERIYTVTGATAFVTDAKGTVPIGKVGGAVRSDLRANTIELRVPRRVADPRGSTWRYTVASGLWDSAAGTWRRPAPGPSSLGAAVPTGGGAGTAPAVYDLLSNNGEPNSLWREERQANDLARSDLADHHVDVDFRRLASKVDEPDPRLTGVTNRIYVSQHEMTPDEGVTISRGLGTNFVYNGRYQPYAFALPSDYYTRLDANPRTRLGFDQCLHPLGANHMVEVNRTEAYGQAGYNPTVTGTVPATGSLGFTRFEQLIDRLDVIYACVLGRGEGVGYVGTDGMVDVIEVWQDIERRFAVDPERRTLHGVSLGAIGTWHVAPLYPDRYAAVMPYIFSPNIVNTSYEQLGNLLNVPTTYAIGTGDMFGQGTQGDPTADALEEHGNEFVYVHYLGRQHEGRIENDMFPFTEKLAYGRKRVVDPPRVRYRLDQGAFNAKLPGRGEAYWVRGMTPRGAGAANVDVTSLGRAAELPRTQVVFTARHTNPQKGYTAQIRGLMRMTEAQFRAFWHPEQWEPGWRQLSLDVRQSTLPRFPVSNGFRMTSGNLGSVRLDADRMRLRLDQPLSAVVSGNGRTTITLLGKPPRSVVATLDGKRVPVRISGSALVVTLPLNGEHRLQLLPTGS